MIVEREDESMKRKKKMENSNCPTIIIKKKRRKNKLREGHETTNKWQTPNLVYIIIDIQ